MSGIPLSNLNGHLTRLVEDIPVYFTWKGVQYYGARSTPEFSETLEVGGSDQAIEYNILVKKDTMPAVTVIVDDMVDEIFLVDNIKMRVAHVRRSPDAQQLLTFAMAFARKS